MSVSPVDDEALALALQQEEEAKANNWSTSPPHSPIVEDVIDEEHVKKLQELEDEKIALALQTQILDEDKSERIPVSHSPPASQTLVEYPHFKPIPSRPAFTCAKPHDPLQFTRKYAERGHYSAAAAAVPRTTNKKNTEKPRSRTSSFYPSAQYEDRRTAEKLQRSLAFDQEEQDKIAATMLQQQLFLEEAQDDLASGQARYDSFLASGEDALDADYDMEWYHRDRRGGRKPRLETVEYVSHRPNFRGVSTYQRQQEIPEDASYEQLLALDETIVREGVPDVTQSTLPTHSYESGGGKCAICQEEYEVGDTIKTLPCLHLYHDQCISHWLASSKLCPICQHSIV